MVIQDGADMQGDGKGSEMQKKLEVAYHNLSLLIRRRKTNQQNTRHMMHER